MLVQALGEYWGRNAKRKFQVKKLRFSPISDTTRPSQLRVIVTPSDPTRLDRPRERYVATHLHNQGSQRKHRDEKGIFGQRVPGPAHRDLRHGRPNFCEL
ncbi:hypothetical protein ACOSP7_021036 [Xanthoceras sorbifolium]